MTMRTSDLFVGAMIGAAGGLNGIALPGLLLVGLGFDASVALTYNLNPGWFPQNDGITTADVLTTALGTVVGWAITRAIAPQGNPRLAPLAAAGVLLAPAGGRIPGRMRYLRTR